MMPPESVMKTLKTMMTQVSREFMTNSDEELNDEADDVLSIFDKVVDIGTAATGTTLP